MTAPSPPERPAWLDDQQYPFRDRWAITPDGWWQHYIDEGPRTAPALVFVHGNPDWSYAYRNLVTELRPDFRCIAVDHIGFGLSDTPKAWPYTPGAHATRLAELLQGLDVSSAVLIGNDWGGAIMTAWAVAHAECVDGLVYINTTPIPADPKDPQARIFSAVMGGPLGRLAVRRGNVFIRVVMRSLLTDAQNKTKAAMAPYAQPMARPRDRRGSWSLPKQIITSIPWQQEYWSRSETITQKRTLIVWGARDRIFTLATRDALASTFANSTTLTIDDVGHYPHEERSPQVAAAIRNFLGTPAPARATPDNVRPP